MHVIGAVESELNKLVDDKSDGVFSNFREFYRCNQEYVRNTLYRLGVHSELDDLVQNTFIKAWLNIKKFKKKSKIKTWLIKIAIHAAYEHFRKCKNRNITTLEITSQHSPFDLNENRDIIKQALCALSMDHRVVIVLCMIEEYSLEEAANMIQVPIGTVKSRLNRARKSMQNILIKMEVNYGS